MRITLLRAWVTRLDLEGRRLELAEGAPIAWDRLLLATASRPNLFGWPGQDLPGVQGLYDLGDLARPCESVRGATRAVVVGGGLIDIELAEMLHSRGLRVTLLVRERSYWDNVPAARGVGSGDDSRGLEGIVAVHGLTREAGASRQPGLPSSTTASAPRSTRGDATCGV